MINMLPFNKKSLPLIVSTLCASMSFASLAEQTPNTSETIEVWGTTITNNSLLQDDIERKQANHLSVLLRDQAGIDVGGSHSIVQGINIRGVDDLDLNITVDGISLTVNDVTEGQCKLTIVPHTFAETTLSNVAVGDAVNVEIDIIARYVERLLGHASGGKDPKGVDMSLLARAGYLNK